MSLALAEGLGLVGLLSKNSHERYQIQAWAAPSLGTVISLFYLDPPAKPAEQSRRNHYKQVGATQQVRQVPAVH